MNRETAISILNSENALFDPEERRVYIPDFVGEPESDYEMRCYGIQICDIYLDNEKLKESMEKGGFDNLFEWAMSMIPAPASIAPCDEGELTWYGFDSERTDTENIGDFVDGLNEEGVLQRLVSDEEFSIRLLNQKTANNDPSAG